jgi:hypothetical protein
VVGGGLPVCALMLVGWLWLRVCVCADRAVRLVRSPGSSTWASRATEAGLLMCVSVWWVVVARRVQLTIDRVVWLPPKMPGSVLKWGGARPAFVERRRPCVCRYDNALPWKGVGYKAPYRYLCQKGQSAA